MKPKASSIILPTNKNGSKFNRHFLLVCALLQSGALGEKGNCAEPVDRPSISNSNICSEVTKSVKHFQWAIPIRHCQ
jgi:hypothetical protein